VKKAEEEGDPIPEPRVNNRFDGHYYNPDGSKEFFDGDGIVGGVNNHVKLRGHKHHHVHHHQVRSNNEDEPEAGAGAGTVPTTTKVAEKSALKKENAKAKAEIEVAEQKIADSTAKI